MKGKIAEIFDSVQGEGLYLGEKQIFVRFFGCNLSCKFCDTKLNCFTEYSPEQLFEKIRLYQNGFHSVSFTGGEPLMQKDYLKEVLKLTSAHGYKNYLETNGTLAEELAEVIDYLDIVAMDLKLPTSTGMGELWSSHQRFLKTASRKEVFLKAIICGSTQEQDLRKALALVKEVNKAAILVLQPNSYEDNGSLTEKLRSFKDICVKEEVLTCVISQIHKIAGIK
ncbi:MAG: 7-carboxy-7-deazaguanine synthase QueE [Candidatus Omnitrophota bacterium]